MKNKIREGWRHLAAPRPSCRTVVQVEVAILLLGAIALTIMPQGTLAGLAAASSWAYGLALAYRPAVAFVGLLAVGALAWATYALLRYGARPRPVTKAAESGKHDTLRPAA